MTSKEALELLELILLNHSSMLVINDKRFEYFNVIKERLEALEKEKEYLKTTNEALNEMLLQASNEAIEFETENEQLKDSIQIKQKQVNECIDSLTQENEKLKKVIATIKEHVQFIIKPIESTDPALEGLYHFCIKIYDKYGYYETLYKDEAIPLKEVLGDE